VDAENKNKLIILEYIIFKMFSDKIKLLPINEIVSIIVNNPINDISKFDKHTYFYDQMFLNNKIIYQYINEGKGKVIINKFCTRFNIKLCDYLLYKEIKAIANTSKICSSCIALFSSYWYVTEIQIIINNNITTLPLSSKCLCERCYNLFPYIKFLELSEKILLLKEFPSNNFINNDIMKYTMCFLIMS